jgi:Recombinase
MTEGEPMPMPTEPEIACTESSEAMHPIVAVPPSASKLKARSKGGKTSALRKIREAKEAYDPEVMLAMKDFRSLGFTLVEVADFMNALGHRTRTGAAWRPSTVDRVLKRATPRKRGRRRWDKGWTSSQG